MKLALLLLLVSATASAAPPIVEIELEREKLGNDWTDIPVAETYPGGLLVPAKVEPAWAEVGLEAGDLIRYIDGSPATSMGRIRDGRTVIELERKRQPVVLRLTVHGPSVVPVDLSQSDFEDSTTRLAGMQLATVVRQKGVPIGVRVNAMYLSIHFDIEEGDIVRTIDGQPIHSDAALVAALGGLRVGKTQISVERLGRPVTIEITRRAPLELATIKRHSATRFDVPRAIVEAVDSDTALLTRKLETEVIADSGAVQGIRLFDVAADSLAAALGLQNGDVLLAIEGRSIGSINSVYLATTLFGGAQQLTIQIERKRKKLAITYVFR